MYSLPNRSQLVLKEALRIVELASRENIPLRIMGACAVMLHSEAGGELFARLGREVGDMDFITYSRYREAVHSLLTRLGYRADERFIYYFGRQRHRYRNPELDLVAEVFFDRLSMNHVIDFSGRLELDYPTITIADLALQKLQIVEINEKDLKDLVVLLKTHRVGRGGDRETIDLDRIAEPLSSEWGFYYTASTNLERLKSYLDRLSREGRIDDREREDVLAKIEMIRNAIESAPKSLRWRIRAKIGTRMKWYTDVEEIVR